MSRNPYLTNNVRIAKFMGYEEPTQEFLCDWFGTPYDRPLPKVDPNNIPILVKNPGTENEVVQFPDTLDYHTNWTSLMTVLEKMEEYLSQEFPEKDIKITIHKHHKHVAFLRVLGNSNETILTLNTAGYNTRLQCIYNPVIDFCIWKAKKG